MLNPAQISKYERELGLGRVVTLPDDDDAANLVRYLQGRGYILSVQGRIRRNLLGQRFPEVDIQVKTIQIAGEDPPPMMTDPEDGCPLASVAGFAHANRQAGPLVWFVNLSCGHVVPGREVPYIGAMTRCGVCQRKRERARQ